MNRRAVIALALGTRPEAIKLAPLYWRLGEAPDRFDPQLW